MPFDNAHFVFLTVFVLTLGFIFFYRKLAFATGLVDKPGGRKQHLRTVAPVGGIAMFSAFFIGMTLIGIDLSHYYALFVALSLVLVLGVIDDAVHLSATIKFPVQIFAALVITFGGGQVINYIGDMFALGISFTDIFAIPFTVICIVGLINAINMIDGIDGLAGGVALTMLLWLSVIGYMSGAQNDVFVLLAMVSALIGFLALNMRTPFRRHALIFMGDAGSMSLAIIIAWFAIEFSQSRHSVPVSPITFGWILALPVIDALSVMIGRIRHGYSPFRADRKHLHHFFLRSGIKESTTTYILTTVSFLMGAIGFAGSYFGVPDIIMLAALLLVVGAYHYLVLHTKMFMHFLHRFANNAKPGI